MMYFIYISVLLTCKMKERLCQNCNKSYASCQSLWNHKQRCKGTMNRFKVGRGVNPEDILGKIENILHSARNGTESEDRHSTLEKPGIKRSARADSIDQSVPKIQVIDDSPVQKEEKKEIHQEDIENKIFEDVTLEERKRFHKLLDELKSRKSHLEVEDFYKMDMILPQYFKKEYGKKADGLHRQNESYSDQINQELRKFQQQLPFLSLEMQMILNFMDEKRVLIRNLLNLLKYNEKHDKDKTLLRWKCRGIITDEEYQDLKDDPSKDTITRVLANRTFNSLNSEK